VGLICTARPGGLYALPIVWQGVFVAGSGLLMCRPVQRRGVVGLICTARPGGLYALHVCGKVCAVA